MIETSMFEQLACSYMSLKTQLEETPKQRTILIVDNVENGLAVHMAHYKTIAVCNDYRAFRNADELITFFNSDSMKYGSHRRDYRFLLCCGKNCNDKLAEYMEKEGLTYDKDAWKWYRKLDSGIFSTDRTSDLEKEIDSHVLPKVADDSEDFSNFYTYDAKGNLKGVIDEEIVQYILAHYDIMIIGKTPYIYDHGVFKADYSGAKLKSIIRKLIHHRKLQKSNVTENIYKTFFQIDDIEATLDECNRQPKYFVNFKNGYWNLKDERIEPHNPKHRCLNQIPHEFKSYDDSIKGENVDKYLNTTFTAEDRQMVLEYLAYGMTADTRQQKFMIFVSTGGTGKGTLGRLLHALVGDSNISEVGLKELESRFATYSIINKLMNMSGDLSAETLNDVTAIKQITGEDRVKCEGKGKDFVFSRIYAKNFFMCNKLPKVKNEDSNGYYRRLLVAKVSVPPDSVDIDLTEKLENEIPYLLQLLLKSGHELYTRDNGIIYESEDSKAAVRQLRNDSDNVQQWLDDNCLIVDPKPIRNRTNRGVLYNDYTSYCIEYKLPKKEIDDFYSSLGSKGFKLVQGTDKVRCYRGILLRETHSQNNLACVNEVHEVVCDSKNNGFSEIDQYNQEELPFD